MKYLYGVAVQGIQSFIFQTNRLQEIVGASELVERICTDFFKELFEQNLFKKDNLILSAAGNIKYIFDDYEECQEIVLKFPFEASKIAPGVTISQAVVKYDRGELKKALNQLEEKLKEQRNKISIPNEIGYMGVGRVRRTGGLAFATNQLHNENNIIDIAIDRKIQESNSTTLFNKISNNLQVDNNKDLWTDIDRLFHNDNKSWIAIIHADGNGLGTIIQALSAKLKSKSDQDVKDAFKTFSKALDNSTKHAAQIAFKEVVLPNKTKDLPYPVRPIILGGDDLTVMIRADLALDFSITFLKEFEKATTRELSYLKEIYGIEGLGYGISACAGIAYVKKSYPFHYGVNLADKLCTEAKKFVKGIVGYEGLVPQSALSFFKIQDSFVESDLKSIKKRSLEACNLSFDYGPYLVGSNTKGYAHADDLLKKIDVVERWANKDNNEANGISKLRQWVAESFKDESTANFMLERMKTINKQFFESMGKIVVNDEISNKNKSMIYDVIQLTSLN